MHEIVTLQFGQQANYIGTHYWNAQESYFTYDNTESPVDHDISFRTGLNSNGQDTYTPRTLIYDLKGAFGTLRRENALYELSNQTAPQTTLNWPGPTVPLRLPQIEPSAYQVALDANDLSNLPNLTPSTVRFWSDYNHIYYHPRGIIQINDYELNSTILPFDKHQTGAELFANLDREQDLLDRDFRPFLEECDALQGVQVFSGLDDAWGGFAARYLECLADELGKGCRWVFSAAKGSTEQRASREQGLLRESNVALSLAALNDVASLHVPLDAVPALGPGYLRLDGTSAWHTAALQMAVVESATVPTRLRMGERGRATFDELEATLNKEGNRRIAAAAFVVDQAYATDEAEASVNGHRDTRMANGIANGVDGDGHDVAQLDIDLFPASRSMWTTSRARTRKPHLFSAVETLRGSWKSEAEIGQISVEARDRFASGRPRMVTYQTSLLFPVLSSSPRIFVLDNQPTRLAVKTILATSTTVAQRLRGFEGTVRRTIGVEEREALSDDLLSMAEEYEEGWSDDDEGTDDD